jgi:hypothetical protein
MEGQRNILKVAAMLLAIGCVFSPAFAGEKLELKSSTTIEVPKPRDLDLHRNVPREVNTPDFGGGAIAPVPPSQSPLLNKKLKELNDRRNNWIFLKPEEMLMDNKASSFFEEKDSTSLIFDLNSKNKSEKTAQERYWAERDRTNNRDDSQEGNDPRQRSRFDQLKQTDRKSIYGDDNTSNYGRNGRTEASFGGAKSTSFLDRDSGRDAANSFELKTPSFIDRPFGGMFADKPREVNAFDKEETKRRTKEREADFERMLQPRTQLSVDVPGVNLNQSLNAQIDSTRMEANPITGRRADFTAGNTAPSSFLQSDRSSSFRSEIAGPSISDLLPKTPTASSISPSAAPAVTVESPVSAARPFVFEIPRRAF